MGKKIKERQIDLTNLLIDNSNKIDWNNIDGKELEFKYDDIIDKLRISKHDKETRYVWVDYKEVKNFKICIDSLKQCKLGILLGVVSSEFKKQKYDIIKDEKRNLTIIDRKYEKDKNGRDWKKYLYHCNKCDYEDWILEG